MERSRAADLISAVQSAGVKHFVLLSAIGPETAPGAALIDTKRAIEGDLAASGLAHTILRPSMFMDNVAMAGSEVLLGYGLTWPFSESALIQPIAAGDIALIAFIAINDKVFVENIGTAIGSIEVAQAIAAAYRLWERDGSGTGDPVILEREFGISLTRFQNYAANLAETWKRGAGTHEGVDP